MLGSGMRSIHSCGVRVFTSLLQEYHDLYELQRKRLESRIGEGCRVMGSASMQCARLASRSLSEYMST